MNAPKVSYCPYCKEHGVQNIEDDLRCAPYYSAYYNQEKENCKYCNRPLVKMNLTVFEFNTILYISGDSAFIDAMDELKAKDIIEFNLKMSQFKNQVNQQKSSEQENDVPRCPNCNSTNIKSISGLSRGASIAMLGIFSKKINKSFECKNCGYTW